MQIVKNTTILFDPEQRKKNVLECKKADFTAGSFALYTITL